MPDIRYPIGRFDYTGPLAPTERPARIAEIAEAPARLRAAVAGLDDVQLDTPYREGGWTVRQVAHHLPDSHVNGYTRMKLALTEPVPTIKPYDEAAWALTPEALGAPIADSLDLLDALHRRWVRLLGALQPADFALEIEHPENGRMSLDRLLALYAWHGRHHVAHITELRRREGWT